jgi:probable phosphoglycerate mutase
VAHPSTGSLARYQRSITGGTAGAMSVRVTLVRHGQSVANAGGASVHPARIALTTHGIKQCERLSLWWPSSAFDAVDVLLVSAYDRTSESARATARRFSLRTEEHPLAHEFTYLSPASCEGTTATERRPRVVDYWRARDPDLVTGEGAESFRQFVCRVDRALSEWRAGGRARVALFTHGQWMQCARWWLATMVARDGARSTEEITGAEMEAFRRFCLRNPVENTQVATVDLGADRAYAWAESTAHLPRGWLTR